MAKTLQEKLVAARALVAKYEAAINAEAILNNVEVGNDVTFTFGRAEKKRSLRGIVTAIKDDEKLGKLVRVRSGEGFDEQSYVVNVRDVTINHSIVTEASEEAAPEGDAEGTDPLSEA